VHTPGYFFCSEQTLPVPAGSVRCALEGRSLGSELSSDNQTPTSASRGALTCAGYSDSDWAEDHLDRQSTLSYTFRIGKGAISWKSRK
jgi:hypothetical protein